MSFDWGEAGGGTIVYEPRIIDLGGFFYSSGYACVLNERVTILQYTLCSQDSQTPSS